MGQSQDATDTAGGNGVRDLVTRRVAPGVYFASDGMLTADSLDSAIAYLGRLIEPGTEGS